MTEDGKLQALIELARDAKDGTPCSPAMLGALDAAIECRRGPSAPEPPVFGPLVVRRVGLPDWWGRENLLLVALGVEQTVVSGLVPGRLVGNVGVVGSGAVVGRFAFSSDNALIAVGERVRMILGELSAMSGGAILIGEDCTATSWARVDARNGGSILVGADGMWEGETNIVTDDMHAIRALSDDQRVNPFGGRVVLERHVWLGDQVRIGGGAHVGADSVVELRAMVRHAIPPGSLCGGSPARPFRQGVTWTRDDLP